MMPACASPTLCNIIFNPKTQQAADGWPSIHFDLNLTVFLKECYRYFASKWHLQVNFWKVPILFSVVKGFDLKSASVLLSSCSPGILLDHLVFVWFLPSSLPADWQADHQARQSPLKNTSGILLFKQLLFSCPVGFFFSSTKCLKIINEFLFVFILFCWWESFMCPAAAWGNQTPVQSVMRQTDRWLIVATHSLEALLLNEIWD